jgi:hypothetical protein
MPRMLRNERDEKMRFMCDLQHCDPAGVKAECKRLGVSVDHYYTALRAELAKRGYPTQR